MARQTQESQATPLKNMDFLAWQIDRAKRTIHKEEVNRIFNGRTRLRSNLHVN